jgi:hypothetical protein
MYDETSTDQAVPDTPLQAAPPIATRLADDSPDAARYRSILQRKIDEGARRAAEVIATIQRDQPRDQIVRMAAAGFEVAPAGGVRVCVADDRYQPTDFALGQIAGRAGIPHPYLRELAAPQAAPWQHDLASEILGRHYGNAGDGRVLVRSVRGNLRGWVSDRYRRLDSRPLVEALADEAMRAGAVPIDGVVTETRVALKVILPQILEPIPGEFLVAGGEWSTSDYGNGVHSFRAYAIRVVCLLCEAQHKRHYPKFSVMFSPSRQSQFLAGKVGRNDGRPLSVTEATTVPRRGRHHAAPTPQCRQTTSRSLSRGVSPRPNGDLAR